MNQNVAVVTNKHQVHVVVEHLNVSALRYVHAVIAVKIKVAVKKMAKCAL